MRKLTKSEKRLSAILSIAIFAMANFYGVSYLLDTESALTQHLSELRATAKTNEIWLREKQFWLARKQWIERQQPRVVPGHEHLERGAVAAADKRDQALVRLEPEQRRPSVKANPT